jgi:hypothetical protein
MRIKKLGFKVAIPAALYGLAIYLILVDERFGRVGIARNSGRSDLSALYNKG